MKPWEMVWDFFTGGKEETPAPQQESKPDYYERLKMAESSGIATAKAKTSSATGHYQFIEQTWKDLTKKHKLNYTLADRTDPVKSKKVVELLTEENKQGFKKAVGKDPSDTNLYTAHFLGLGTAIDFAKAKPFTPAVKVVGMQAARANKNIFYDNKTKKPRTVAEVHKILQKKIGE